MQTTDIMIHINGSLDAAQQQAIESELREIEGVIAPRFDQPHLLVILNRPVFGGGQILRE